MKTIYIKSLYFARFDVQRHSGKIDAELLISTVKDLIGDESNEIKLDYLTEIVENACSNAFITGSDGERYTTDTNGKLNLKKELTWAETHSTLLAGNIIGVSHEEGCMVLVPIVQGLNETKEESKRRIRQAANSALHQLQFWGDGDDLGIDVEDSDW
jgi:hypothetical protein